MPKLIILRGLPASGKTTWARNFIAREFALGNTKVVNVCRDDLRAMHGLSKVPSDFEGTITALQHTMVRAGLKEGCTVLSSDTNLKAKYVRELLKLAVLFNAEVEFVDFDIPLDECIKRDALRMDYVGEAVIRSFYDRYMKKGNFPPHPTLNDVPIGFDPYVPDITLPKAFIVDIDGTVAKMNGRSPFDYDKVLTDLPHQDVINLISDLRQLDNKILFVSGREDICLMNTLGWLNKYAPQLYVVRGYGEVSNNASLLYMRKRGDYRQDVLIKYEIFNEHIRNRYNVIGVFDDRSSVVRLWRDIGLRCYQVADGDF